MLVGLDQAPEIVATVVTLGVSDRLRKCLASLEAIETERRLAILCIINGDGAQAGGSDWGRAEYRIAGLNLGWGGGLALGRTIHDAPNSWLIQDDMVVAPDSLDALLAELDFGHSASCPTVVNDDGTMEPNSFGIHARVLPPSPWWPPDPPLLRTDLASLTSMPYLPSRGMLVCTKTWDEVGGFDPSYYPVIWGDVDFCTALRDLGHTFSHSFRATVQHAGQASTARPYGDFLFVRNEHRFVSKWRGRGLLREEIESTESFGSRGDGGSQEAGVQLHAPTPELELIPDWLIRSTAISAAGTLQGLARVFTTTANEREGALADLAAANTTVSNLQAELALAQADLEEAIRQAESDRKRLAASIAELTELRTRFEGVLLSKSWRVTGPARWLGDKARKR